MKDKIIIFGSSGHAKSIAVILELLNYEIVGFVDSYLPKGVNVLSYKTIGNESVLKNCLEVFGTKKVVVGIGDNFNRRKVVDKIKLINSNIDFPYIISPKANVANYISIGQGTVVHSNSFINVENTIGDFCVINSSSIIEHNTLISDYCNISPSASIGGNVTIQNSVFIGASATIIQNKCIGENSVIGAGAVVNRDIPKNVLAVGVPAVIKVENYKNKNLLKWWILINIKE